MKKILIVDDEPSIGNLLQETLTGAGYCAMRAYSGTEALLTVANTKPDLVLLDLMLPGLSGEELLPRLRGIRPASAGRIPRTLVEQMHGTISARYEDDKLYIDIFFREQPCSNNVPTRI